MPTLMDPFEALHRLQQSLDTSRGGDWLRGRTSGRGTYPPINVFERRDEVVVVAELPGIDKTGLDIQIHRNRLRVSGRRDIGRPEAASAHRRERHGGAFDRTLTVPFEIDRERAGAAYKHGILWITLPRAEGDKPRTIEVS